MSKFKFEEQFRAENPQTIGEADKHYDLENYKEWLEEKLSKYLNFADINYFIFKTPNYYEYRPRQDSRA